MSTYPTSQRIMGAVRRNHTEIQIYVLGGILWLSTSVRRAEDLKLESRFCKVGKIERKEHTRLSCALNWGSETTRILRCKLGVKESSLF